MIIRSRHGNPYTVLAVTSCKGGIGKSTLAAGLSEMLALNGHRLMVIDCDFSNRAMDLCFGCRNTTGYDITDLVSGAATPEECCIDTGRENVLLVAGPAPGAELFEAEDLRKAVDKAARAFSCDIVIIDTPGASGGVTEVVSAVSDGALIVVSHNPASVRGAEQAGMLLGKHGLENQYLIINRFDPDSVLTGKRPGIEKLTDSTHIPLIGVVPDSPELELCTDCGSPVSAIRRDRHFAAAALKELAMRLDGKRMPLMSFYPERKRIRLVNS